jgi:outer membrane autotransporter protein
MFNFTNKPKRSTMGRRSCAAALAVTLLASTSYEAFAANPPIVLPPGIMSMIGPLLDPILAGPPDQVWPKLSGVLAGFAPDIYAALNGPLTQLNTVQPDLIPKLIKAAVPLLADPNSVTAGVLSDLLTAIIPQAAPGAPLNPLVQPGGFLDAQLKTTLAPFLKQGGIADDLLGKGKPLAYLLKPGGLLAGLAAPGEPFEAFANEPDPTPPPVVAPVANTTPPPDTTAAVVAPPVEAPPVVAQPVVAPSVVAPPPIVVPKVVVPANTPIASTYGPGSTVDAADIKTGPVAVDGATIVFNKPSTVDNVIASAAGGLTVDTEANGVLAGAISGPGGLTKIGGATLTLSAINTYTGDTDVKSGLLNIAGSLVNSTIVVENGATLGGSGTAFQIHALSGGAVSPGNSIGTLHAGTGGVQMDPGSIYHVEIDKDGRSDRISTQGAASIGGAKLVVTREFSTAALSMADLADINQTYDILDAAGGISGKFDTSSLPHYVFFDIGVDYSNVTSVMLTVGRNGLTFAAVGSTPNQRAVGAGVQGLGNGNPLYGMMLSSSSVDDARAMEQQLSGEIHGDVLGEVLDDSAMIRNAVIDRLNNRDPEGSAFWFKAIDSFGSTASDGNAAKVKRQTDGLSAGVDASLGGSWLAGVAGNYEATPLQTKGAGSASMQSYHFALYTGGDLGGLSLHLGGAYGHYTAKTTRLIPFLSAAETARGNTDQTQVFGEVGYPIVSDDTTIEPFVDLSYTDVHLASFAETEGLGALEARGQSIDRMQSILGGRYQVSFHDNDTIFTPNVTLGWVHNFSGITPGVRMGFVDGPVHAFTIDGVSTNADAALIRAGLDAAIGSGFNLGVGYEGQIGERTQDHAVRLSIRMNY